MVQKKRKRTTNTNPQVKESTISTRILQLIFLVTYLVLCYLFFTDGNLSVMGGIMIFDFIIGIAYWAIQKKHIIHSKTIQYNMRIILSFLIALITITFYALALIRTDQMYPGMKTTLLVGGAFVYLAILSSSKGIIQQFVDREQQ